MIGGMPKAVRRLERLRAQLDADSLTATFSTRHGTVALCVTRDGLRVFVNGEEVPVEAAA